MDKKAEGRKRRLALLVLHLYMERGDLVSPMKGTGVLMEGRWRG